MPAAQKRGPLMQITYKDTIAVLAGMCCFLYMWACRPLSYMRGWSHLGTHNFLIERADAGHIIQAFN